jgi:CheY-like chemotaxis protein
MIPPTRNFTVLYVEDEENDVTLLQYAWKEALIKERLDVVKNGKEALNYFQRQTSRDGRFEFSACGLVLLDLNLPLLSGFEILAWIRKHELLKRLPVIILTSSNQNHDIQLAYELGANAYLIKPSSLDALVELLWSVKNFWLDRNTFPHPEP